MANRHGYPKHKVVWFGVYRTFVMNRNPARILEHVVESRLDAEKTLQKILEKYPWQNEKNYMIEEVDITMRAWRF